MIRWHKIRTVAAFEFFATVKRPAYLIGTFGMPLFLGLYAGIVALPAYYADKRDREPVVFGVVDPDHVLALAADTPSAQTTELPSDVKNMIEVTGQRAAIDRALPRSNYVFRPFADEPTARSRLAARQIKGYFVLPADYFKTGTVQIYTPDTFSMSGLDARSAFGTLLRERLLKGRVDDAIGARIVSPVKDAKRFAISRTGEVRDGGQVASIARLAVPIVFTVLFLLSVLMTSGYLLQGTATEKENKVVEVLLASANPDEILGGKLLGLGAAGLLQIVVWLTMMFAMGLGVIPLLLEAHIEMPWLALAIALPLFMVAFLFFGSLMLGTGSLGSNMRESQQLAMVWSLTAALPMMMLGVIIREPHGVLARVLTWVPFTSSPIVMIRASMDAESLAWWEIAGPLLLLTLATWLAIRVGARLFRVGLLSSGARPSLREVWRQARLAD
jgi:ABC-2 type transport system permease protein